jgi:hypothetical protein
MPPTTAPTRTRARRWSVVLALQLAAGLLATGAASATGTGELVWLGEAGGQAEERWTTDPSVRPWRDADGDPAAYGTAKRSTKGADVPADCLCA